MTSPQLENGYTKIANEILDAFARYRIPGEQMQCVFYIFRRTYGWGEKLAKIKLKHFVENTRMSKPAVSRALKSLKDKKIIIVIKKDNESHSTYGINKRYKEWKPLSKKITLSKKIMTVIKKDNEALSKKIIPPYIKKVIKESIKEKEQKYILPEWIDKNLWSEYKKMRIRIKKPMTDFAEKLAVNELQKLIDAGENQKAVIEQSIMKSWQGVFPIKKNGFSQKAPNRQTAEPSKYGDN